MGLNDYALTLHGTLTTAQRPIDITRRLPNWRRSIMRRGGFWTGTANYVGTRAEMMDLYLNGIFRRLTENTGGGHGAVTWEGFLAEAELTLDGVAYKRSMLDMCNASKLFYTKISGNLITNPSVETNPWAAEEGPPATLERSTSWAAKGSYSMHCVTNAAANDEGMEIENGITIEAEVAYQMRISVNVVSGTWVLKVKEEDSGNDATIAKVKSRGTGDQIMVAEIGEENEFTTVRVILIEKTTGSSGEIYADNAILAYAPVKAETDWYTDTASIATFGRIEDILLESERTNAEAIAKAQHEIATRAWPRSKPPNRLEVAEVAKPDGLSLLFCGYVFTMNWLHINTTDGEDDADAQIAALVAESDYISAGYMESNTMQALVDASYPTRLWDKVKEIIKAGDESQNRWEGGVYADRYFHYRQTSNTLRYHWRGGHLVHAIQRPVAPWEARPALTRIDNMPVGPGAISGDVTDDPRNVYLEGVEFIAPNRIVILPEMGREVA